MKKSLILLAAALGIFAGCKKSGNVSVKETFRIQAKTVESKTCFGTQTGNTIAINWEIGDKLSVDGTSSEALTDGGSNTASFEFPTPVAQTFHAAYPAAAVSEYAEASAVITLPEEQAYVENGYDPAAGILLGIGSILDGEGSVELKHAMAYLRITPNLGDENVKIKSIEINSFGGVISGAFNTDFNSLTAAEGNDKYRVNVKPATAIALGTPVHIAIPARSYKGNIEMTLIDENDNYMKVTSEFSEEHPFNAEAGHVYPTAITYKHYQDPLPENLYMLGDGTPGGWSSTTKLDGNGEGIYTIEGVSLSGGNFKIYPDDPYTSGNWAPYYGASTSATASNISIEKVPSTSADERNFDITRWGYTTGVYNVTVDLNNMKITFEKLNLRTIYLYGAAFNGKPDWDYWCPLTETGNNTDVYKATIDLLTYQDYDRGFKIYRTISDWNNEYCCDTNKSIPGDANNVYFDHKNVAGDNQVVPSQYGITNGVYTVTVDFNTKKVSFQQ